MNLTPSKIQKMRELAEMKLVEHGAVPRTKNKTTIYYLNDVRLTPWEEQKDDCVLFRWDDTTRFTGKEARRYPHHISFLIGEENGELTIIETANTL